MLGAVEDCEGGTEAGDVEEPEVGVEPVDDGLDDAPGVPAEDVPPPGRLPDFDPPPPQPAAAKASTAVATRTRCQCAEIRERAFIRSRSRGGNRHRQRRKAWQEGVTPALSEEEFQRAVEKILA